MVFLAGFVTGVVATFAICGIFVAVVEWRGATERADSIERNKRGEPDDWSPENN